VKLKAHGKEFSLECGPLEMSEKQFYDEYHRVVDAVNGGKVSPEDCDRIWQESEPFQRSADFVVAVALKGFKLPKGLS
jgi:hypothetical protein